MFQGTENDRKHDKIKHTCEHCGTILSKYGAYRRHLNESEYCKKTRKYKEQINNLEEEQINLQQDINYTQKEIDIIKKQNKKLLKYKQKYKNVIKR